MMRFFLSVVTRHQQNTDSRTWSILKTSSGRRKLRQRSFLSKLNMNLSSYIAVDVSSTRSVNILETFNAYQHRIIVS